MSPSSSAACSAPAGSPKPRLPSAEHSTSAGCAVCPSSAARSNSQPSTARARRGSCGPGGAGEHAAGEAVGGLGAHPGHGQDQPRVGGQPGRGLLAQRRGHPRGQVARCPAEARSCSRDGVGFGHRHCLFHPYLVGSLIVRVLVHQPRAGRLPGVLRVADLRLGHVVQGLADLPRQGQLFVAQRDARAAGPWCGPRRRARDAGPVRTQARATSSGATPRPSAASATASTTRHCGPSRYGSTKRGKCGDAARESAGALAVLAGQHPAAQR